MKLVLALILTALLPAFASPLVDNDHGIIGNIALCILGAGLFGVLIRRLKLPPLLGYLVAGLALGPLGLRWITDPRDIHDLSEMGLIILLFMIGLEMDLKKMLSAGKWVLVPGLVQFPLSVILSLGLLWIMHFLSWGSFELMYLALALGLSSTMIVVKTLYESKEINSLAGRMSLGILIIQDLWAIVILAMQPQISHPEWQGLVLTFGVGFILVAGALLFSKYLLPPLFRTVEKMPEVVLVLSLAWCFLVSLVAARVGLSMEMGALIAGVAVGTYPYSHDVTARVVSLRDFFVTLFFVTLGLRMTWVDPQTVLIACILTLLLPLLRLLTIFVPMRLLKAPIKASLESSILLSQMSEFSLVILAIAVSLGQIKQDLLTLAVWVFAFGAVTSGILGQKYNTFQKYLYRMLRRGSGDHADHISNKTLDKKEYDVVFFGLGRLGQAFLEEIKWYDPEMCKRIAVVDVNLKFRDWLEENQVDFHYGDLGHPLTYQPFKGCQSKVVVSGIPDAYLRGCSNASLLRQMRKYFPDAYHVINTSSLPKAEQLYAKGAHHVLIPEQMAGHALADQVRLVLRQKKEEH